MPTARKLTPEEYEKYEELKQQSERCRIEEIRHKYALVHEPWRFESSTVTVAGSGIETGTGTIQLDAISTDVIVPTQTEASICSTISSHEPIENASCSHKRKKSTSQHENEFQGKRYGAIPNHSTPMYPMEALSSQMRTLPVLSTSDSGIIRGENQEDPLTAGANPLVLVFVQAGGNNFLKESNIVQQYSTSYEIMENMKNESDDKTETLVNGKKYESHDADALEKLLFSSDSEIDEDKDSNEQVGMRVPNPFISSGSIDDSSASAINELIRAKTSQEINIQREANSPSRNSQCLPSTQLQQADIERARIWNVEKNDGKLTPSTAEKLKNLMGNT